MGTEAFSVPKRPMIVRKSRRFDGAIRVLAKAGESA